MKRGTVLVILDGWGVGAVDASNPIHAAAPDTVAQLAREFPSGALQASGLAVGVPWEEPGNCGVGHLTIGAGRAILQPSYFVRTAIEDGSFMGNETLRAACARGGASGHTLHLVGLVTRESPHASISHLKALLELAGRERVTRCVLHLVVDGYGGPAVVRDLVADIAARLHEHEEWRIASMIGSAFAMDRENNFDRTEQAYRLLTEGRGARERSWEELIERELVSLPSSDRLPAATIGEPAPFKTGDAVFFWNVRGDRMRQLVAAFSDEQFSAFPRTPIPDLMVSTMTSYDPSFHATVAFPDSATVYPVTGTLGESIASTGGVQVRIAETSKYPHVTYFFNGKREAPFPGEYRILIPSPRVARWDAVPALAAPAITDRALLALREGAYDFMLVNYANPDMVAHTGNFDATVQAIRATDAELYRLAEAVLAGNHQMLIVGDHGNAEVLIDPVSGRVDTSHSPNMVPCYLVAPEFRHEVRMQARPEPIGMLSDVAPTILALMGIPKPEAMTGQSLLPQLH